MSIPDFGGDGIVTDEEVIKLIANIGFKGEFTDDDIQAIVDWARFARISAGAVDLALLGAVQLSVVDGEVAIQPCSLDENGLSGHITSFIQNVKNRSSIIGQINNRKNRRGKWEQEID